MRQSEKNTQKEKVSTAQRIDCVDRVAFVSVHKVWDGHGELDRQ